MAGVDYGHVRLVFVDEHKLVAHKPCSRVEPVDNHHRLSQKQVNPVTASDMVQLMGDDGIGTGGIVRAVDHHIAHPAERRNTAVVNHYERITLAPLLPAR